MKRKENNKSKYLYNLIKSELKIITTIILIFVFLSILSLINSIILISPRNNQIIYDRTPEFSWASMHNYFKFYLSDDEDFNNLIKYDNVFGSNYDINETLYFGDYYWKVVAIKNNKEISSNVGKFRINSVVAAEINETLKNVGNTQVQIEILDKNGGITGSAVLDIDKQMSVTNNSLYKIKQNE